MTDEAGRERAAIVALLRAEQVHRFSLAEICDGRVKLFHEGRATACQSAIRAIERGDHLKETDRG